MPRSTSAFSRFKQQLAQEVGSIETWAQEAIEELYQFLPDFGKQLVLDGKIIETYASPHGQKRRKDKRADVEADFTIKAKYHKNGRVMTEIFDGYGCHLLVDAVYELLIPVARSSHKFKQLYKKRSSVERVNGRLEWDFRLEDHTIRGLGKMTSAVGMSFLIGLALPCSN